MIRLGIAFYVVWLVLPFSGLAFSPLQQPNQCSSSSQQHRRVPPAASSSSSSTKIKMAIFDEISDFFKNYDNDRDGPNNEGKDEDASGSVEEDAELEQEILSAVAESSQEPKSIDDAELEQEILSAMEESKKELKRLEDQEEWSQWTVAKLKAELKKRGAAVSGKKADLVARLEGLAAAGAPQAPAPETPKAKDESISDEQIEDYSKWTVAQLKEELRSKGLKVGGKKQELVQRIQKELA